MPETVLVMLAIFGLISLIAAIGMIVYKMLGMFLQNRNSLKAQLIATERQSDERAEDIRRIVRWLRHEGIRLPDALLDEINDTRVLNERDERRQNVRVR